MTARTELIEAMFDAYLKVAPWGDEGAETQQQAIGAACDALTPDLWLRYGLEMGWVEEAAPIRATDRPYPNATGGNEERVTYRQAHSQGDRLYRFTVGAEGGRMTDFFNETTQRPDCPKCEAGFVLWDDDVAYKRVRQDRCPDCGWGQTRIEEKE